VLKKKMTIACRTKVLVTGAFDEMWGGILSYLCVDPFRRSL
jgi:hypothetical protein